jgi:predicted phosphoribosyltransferase
LTGGIPVSSQEAAREISATVDEWVCPQPPSPFYAVGAFFRDFTQVEDDEVVAMLRDIHTGGNNP